MPNTSAHRADRQSYRAAQVTSALGPFNLGVVRRAGGAVVVRVYGDVDAITVPLLETALLTELDVRPKLLVVDLAGVTWFGVSGLITLVDVQEVAAATGVSVRIAGAAPSVRRLVELAGLTERFTRGSPAVRADGGLRGDIWPPAGRSLAITLIVTTQ
jgi:anti-anti-sigma factor